MFEYQFIEAIKRDISMQCIISLDKQPDRIIEMSIKGWDSPILVVDDCVFIHICDLFNSYLNKLNEVYKNNHFFTEPILSYSPDNNEWKTKIGIMKKERFEEIYSVA